MISKLFLKTLLQGGSVRNSLAVDSRVLRRLVCVFSFNDFALHYQKLKYTIKH